MSRYGSPGEPPWPGPGPEEYGAPADPWEPRSPGAWGESTVPHREQPGYDPGPPVRPGPPYGPPPGSAGPAWGGDPGPGPAGPSPGGRPLGLYLVVTVLVVVAAVGVGYALFLLSGDGGDPQAVETPTSSPGADQTTGPAPTRDNIGMNAAMALVDDCLVNDGTAAEPQMRIVSCDTGDDSGSVFQVLEIFPERVEGQGAAANERAQQVCAGVEGYTHHYYEVGETASFVLCMAEVE